jgi:NAD(P)-dependent dehydrogenase (short-subunit alcohol dehydrogenase family)
MHVRAVKTVMLVGTSRGLGLGLVDSYLSRDWRVIATVRGEANQNLLSRKEEHPDRLILVEQVDITCPDSIASLASRVDPATIDLLFVNAGMADIHDAHAGKVSTEIFSQVMLCNTLGPIRVIESLIDRLPTRTPIAVMSSRLGSVSLKLDATMEVYAASKAALNNLLRSVAARHGVFERTWLAVSPGWVKTDMGGSDAPLDIQTSCFGVLNAIELFARRPGVFFIHYTGEELQW